MEPSAPQRPSAMNSQPEGIFYVFPHPSRAGEEVFMEDDRETFYAYWVKDEDAVSSVWMGQRPEPAALDPDWQPGRPHFRPMATPDRLTVVWREASADILLDGEIFARIRPDAREGWCRYAPPGSPWSTELEP